MDPSPHLGQQAREDQSKASAIDMQIQAAIGSHLRDQYEKMPRQPLSELFLDLLKRLDESDPTAKARRGAEPSPPESARLGP
jgi:hypothetical protein